MTIKINELEYAANVSKQSIRNKETGPMQDEIVREEGIDYGLLEELVEIFYDKFPEIITPKKFTEITGGLMTDKDLAILHLEGCGIQPRLKFAGRACYSKEAVIGWLIDNFDYDR